MDRYMAICKGRLDRSKNDRRNIEKQKRVTGGQMDGQMGSPLAPPPGQS